MTGINWLVRTQLRRGWRAYVGLALLVGLAGGLVLAGLAGARRNETAFDRMVQATDGWDVLINPDQGLQSRLTMEDVRAVPVVERAGRVEGISMVRADVASYRDISGSPIVLAGDGEAYYSVGRPMVRDGAMPAIDDADAMVIDQRVAEEWGVRAGDTVAMRIISSSDFEAAGNGAELQSVGAVLPMRVAATAVTQDSVASAEGGFTQFIVVTPAFLAAHPEASAGYWGVVAQLRSGGDVAALRSTLTTGRPLDDQLVFQTLDAVRAEAAATIAPQTTVLLVFSVVAALLGTLVVGQAVWRRLQGDSVGRTTLAAIGVTHRQRFVAAMARVSVLAVAGSVVAVMIAVALSPVTPIGDARAAEPTPGIDVNVAMFGLGALAIIAATLLCAVVPAWRTTAVGPDMAPARRSRSVAAVARSGVAPATVAGVRFALDPGRGPNSVPVRTTIVGAVSGVLIIAGSLTFATSLQHFTTTPADNGRVANAELSFDGEPPALDRAAAALDAEPEIETWSLVTIGEFGVGNRRVQYVASQAGDLQPAQLVSGRAPTDDREVVLGRRTLAELNLSEGDTVRAELAGGARDLRVVGTAVMPLIAAYPGSDKGALGTGAWLGVSRSDDTRVDQVDNQQIWLNVADGVDQDRLVGDLKLGMAYADGEMSFNELPRPAIVRALGDLDRTPLYLAFLLCALVAATVVHALTAAVWRRRRDIALLQTLGFTRGQVRCSVLVQATVIGLVALVIGLPLGVVAGRWAWSVLSDALGVVAGVTVPFGALVAVTAVVLVMVNLVGLLPATRVLRQSPAQTLRSE